VLKLSALLLLLLLMRPVLLLLLQHWPVVPVSRRRLVDWLCAERLLLLTAVPQGPYHRSWAPE